MSNVIHGEFPQYHSDDRPNWVVTAMKRHSGLTFKKVGDGGYLLDGADVELPSGRKIHSCLGYLRTTGQWRLSAGNEEVEVFCCKTRKTDYVSVNLVHGVRLIDDLND